MSYLTNVRTPVIRPFNGLFDELFVAPPTSSSWNPPADVYETDAAYVLTADVPGLVAADLEISFENDTLTLGGQRSVAVGGDDRKPRISERRHGAFRRSFTFPVSVDGDAITAQLNDGVLTVTVAKATEAKARRIEISAS